MTRGQIIGFSLVAMVAVYATWPDGDSLDYSSCEPKAGLSQFSANIYGRFFWEQALANAKKLADRDTLETIFRKAQRETRQNDQKLEELYAKYPKVAPTPGQRTAARLRAQADEIESQEAFGPLFATERRIAAEAQTCVQVIAQKLRGM